MLRSRGRLTGAIHMREAVNSRIPRTDAMGRQLTNGGRSSMRLAKKMNLKDGMKVRVVARPPGVDLDDVEVTSSAKADAILVFVRTLADVDKRCAPAVEAEKQDRLAWNAYPMAKQLGTDLNRDMPLRRLLKENMQDVLHFRLKP